jgi:hypothetical protein
MSTIRDLAGDAMSYKDLRNRFVSSFKRGKLGNADEADLELYDGPNGPTVYFTFVSLYVSSAASNSIDLLS